MKKKLWSIGLMFLLLWPALSSVGQTPLAVRVMVGTGHVDWSYRMGEPVKFLISVWKNGNLLPDVSVSYVIGPEKMAATRSDSVKLTSGKLEIDGGTMTVPGFLRCTVIATVDGVKYKGLATAAFSPEAIRPTVESPADFDAFWDKGKKELAEVPMDARMRILPERCTGLVDVFEVSLGNINRSRFYGILCVPKKAGKYPALFIPPGAGVRPYYGEVGLAERGVITFMVGIHGIPVTMEENVYSSLREGALKNYWTFNMDDRNGYYYRRVYLGCIRSIDFLESLPQFDGEHLGVTGGSQGGALTIITAALDPRVKVLAAHYPALADLTGFLHQRAGGWPGFFDSRWGPTPGVKEKSEVLRYYDVVNFAREVKVEGLYTWGYNDETVPPTSMYAAYNVIMAPKKLILNLESGHFDIPETVGVMNDWLLEKLKGGAPAAANKK